MTSRGDNGSGLLLALALPKNASYRRASADNPERGHRRRVSRNDRKPSRKLRRACDEDLAAIPELRIHPVRAFEHRGKLNPEDVCGLRRPPLRRSCTPGQFRLRRLLSAVSESFGKQSAHHQRRKP